MDVSADPRTLSITRLIDAPREAVYRAWTDPALFRQWIAPAPYTVTECALDPRPGGANFFVMRNPGGQEMPCRGVYLELVPNERIVFTDAYTRAWEPAEKPFMTVTVTLTEEAGKTRYTIIARHWTEADRAQHEAMGFERGWSQCAAQLAALVEPR
jgi:uncharacterized protein YndB with AHSA1/START domain